jgi:quinoprotein glucose dehydrogenase
VTIDLKNGGKVTGILQKETKEGVFVKSGQKADTLVHSQDIAKKTLAGSSMPPMYLLLSKKEIRDLLSFLETLK